MIFSSSRRSTLMKFLRNGQRLVSRRTIWIFSWLELVVYAVICAAAWAYCTFFV